MSVSVCVCVHEWCVFTHMSGVFTQGFLNSCLLLNARFPTDRNKYKKIMGNFSKMSERISVD